MLCQGTNPCRNGRNCEKGSALLPVSTACCSELMCSSLCLSAAALATGCEVTITKEPGSSTYDLRQNKALGKVHVPNQISAIDDLSVL